ASLSACKFARRTGGDSGPRATLHRDGARGGISCRSSRGAWPAFYVRCEAIDGSSDRRPRLSPSEKSGLLQSEAVDHRQRRWKMEARRLLAASKRGPDPPEMDAPFAGDFAAGSAGCLYRIDLARLGHLLARRDAALLPARQ